MNDQIKKTYTERMIDSVSLHLIEKGMKAPQISHTIEGLKAFQQEEFDKKKADSSKIPFGKYRGKSINSILAFDKQYLTWLVRQDLLDSFEDLKANIKGALN